MGENERKLIRYKDRMLKTFIDNIKKDENFTIIKYGDFLEMMFTEDETRSNCDGSHYDKVLKSKIIDAYIFYLTTERSYICKWDTDLNFEKKYDELYEEFYESFYTKFLYFNIIIHKMNVDGYFDLLMIDFYKTIRDSERKIIYVCNKYLGPFVQKVFKIEDDDMIIVPEVDAYKEHDTIFLSALKKLNARSNCIILTSCGFYAPVLIKELMSNDIGINHTYIDVGSSFDGLYRGSRNFNWSEKYKEELSKIYLNKE